MEKGMKLLWLEFLCEYLCMHILHGFIFFTLKNSLWSVNEILYSFVYWQGLGLDCNTPMCGKFPERFRACLQSVCLFTVDNLEKRSAVLKEVMFALWYWYFAWEFATSFLRILAFAYVQCAHFQLITWKGIYRVQWKFVWLWYWKVLSLICSTPFRFLDSYGSLLPITLSFLFFNLKKNIHILLKFSNLFVFDKFTLGIIACHSSKRKLWQLWPFLTNNILVYNLKKNIWGSLKVRVLSEIVKFLL